MRILYHSAAPWIPTGYGNCTQEIAPRLHNGEHEVAIQCLSSVKNKKIKWHGDELDYELESPITVYPGKRPFGLPNLDDSIDDFNPDVIFTHFDTWMEPARKKYPTVETPYVSWVIVDHYPVPDEVIKQVNNAHETVAMSKYARRELMEKGIRPRYIPHGVDTDTFRPLNEDEKPEGIEISDGDGGTEVIDPDDRFIFGMVAANQGARKNIPNQLHAFKLFLEEVNEDALMYIHTEQKSGKGYDLYKIQKELNIPERNVIWPSSDDYGSVGKEYLNGWYNVFDVYLNCSYGESWGLTITEAMAAGTPAIVTNFSSMPEQLGVNREPGDPYSTVSSYRHREHGVTVTPDTPVWKEKVNARQFIVKPESILKAMKYYYINDERRRKDGKLARDYVENYYDWEDCVLPKFEEMFSNLEARIQ